MKNYQNIKLLKSLYQYKSLGYKYFDDVKLPDVQEEEIAHDSDTIENLNKIVKSCSLCDLSKSRKCVVFGEGNLNAKIMFVGEGPGAMEDESGRPFVGKAGQLLTKIIETTLLLKREDVYIANIVKCRPPNNRVPTPEEADKCLPFLLKQIEFVKPKIIISLGATSYRYLTKDQSSISRVRGEIINFGDGVLIPTFHPSYLLRNPSAKKFVFADMLKVRSML